MHNQPAQNLVREGMPRIAPLDHYRKLMRRKTIKRLPVKEALSYLADLIDTALDAKQREGLTHALQLGDELGNRTLTAGQSIVLHYFLGNAWSNLRTIDRAGTDASWNWEQHEIEREITNFRMALNNPEFEKTEKYRRCQLLTNLGNLMNHVGRFVEAQEYWNRALQIMPDFGMCLGNRGCGLSDYARSIPRRHDSILMIDEAQRSLNGAIRSRMIHSTAREYFVQRLAGVEGLQDRYRKGKHKFDLYRSLGVGRKERNYRRWCLEKHLFLNYLNDLAEQACAAGDNVILPALTRPIGEGLHFEGLYNQIKQEFVSARYLYFEAASSMDPHFSDKRVLLYDTMDCPSYSLAVEKVKAAYRIVYSVFDKMAFFLNAYLELGIEESLVTFRTFWYVDRQKKRGLRSEFESRKNWALRGLFWLSKDVFEDTTGFREAIEPDAQELKKIRDHIEHKYLKVLEFGTPPFMAESFCDRLALSVTRIDLYKRTLRLLKIARAGLIYLSVAVYWEERNRHNARTSQGKIAELHLKTVEDRRKV